MTSRSLAAWRRSILTRILRLIMSIVSAWGAPGAPRTPFKMPGFISRRVATTSQAGASTQLTSSKFRVSLASSRVRRITAESFLRLDRLPPIEQLESHSGPFPGGLTLRPESLRPCAISILTS